MALDHPAVRLSSGRWLPHARVVELGVLVALAVAVVVVAAVWESSSDAGESVAMNSPESQAGSVVSPQLNTRAIPNADEMEAVAVGETKRSTLSSVSEGALTEHGATALATQIGIVREAPDFGGRTLPGSFERYQVQRGETLEMIARARHLTVTDLLTWNLHLDEDSVLIPGEWVSIPQWNAAAVADELSQSSEAEKSGRGGG